MKRMIIVALFSLIVVSGISAGIHSVSNWPNEISKEE